MNTFKVGDRVVAKIGCHNSQAGRGYDVAPSTIYTVQGIDHCGHIGLNLNQVTSSRATWVDVRRFRLATGDELRDAGIAKAASKATKSQWLPRAVSAFMNYRSFVLRGTRFTFDQFHQWAVNRGVLNEPDNSNAWGALPRKIVKLGLATPTGEYKKATRPAAHSRKVQVWEIA